MRHGEPGCAPIASISNPAPQRVQNSAAVPSCGSTLKITMFVSTRSPTSPKPRIARATSPSRRIGVVFGQPIHMVLKRVHARAASTPAWRMPPPNSLRIRRAFLIRSFGPAMPKPIGGAESFGKANTHRVKMLRPAAGIDAAGHGSIEQSAPSR